MDNNTSEINVEKKPEDVVTLVPESEIETESTVETKKRTRRKLSYYFTNGLVATWLGLLTEAVYRALCEGLFGKIFTSYSANQSKFDNGYFGGRLLGGERAKQNSRKLRRVFAEGFEKSFFLGFVKRSSRIMLETSLKNYGNYCLTFGLYSVFSYFFRTYFTILKPADMGHFITGIVFIFIAIPMLMSKNSLAEVLGKGIVSRAVLCDAFGMRDESFEIDAKQTKTRANLAIILGMASGLLTLFMDPVYIPIVALLIVAIAVIMVTPEIGILVSLFALPLFSFYDMPSVLLTFFVGVTALGYIVKLIRGKRIIKFELIDLAVLFFLIVLISSGIISAGARMSFYEAAVAGTLMLVYFLIANMMRTRQWINRCVLALVSSATITAVLGVIEYFFGDVSTQWLDTAYFSDIKGRVVSLFDNSNVLAFYLVLIFPFALDLILRARSKGERFLACFSGASIALCVVFTWSRGAWIGIVVSMLVYFMIKTRKVIKAFFAFCLSLPLLAVVLPPSIINRVLSIGDISDSSTYYRVLTWKGSLNAMREAIFGGYGFGMSAFESAYPRYAYAGIEAAEHTHSLFLQILFGMGIVGILAFFIIMLLFSQKNLEFFSKKQTAGEVGIAVAAFASFVSAVTMGMFDYIWYNNRVMFLFWAVIGLSCAVIRMGDDLEKRRQTEITCDKNSAYIDI